MKLMNSKYGLGLVAGVSCALASGCIRTQAAPEPPAQVDVQYGPQLFVAEHSLAATHCAEVGALDASDLAAIEFDGAPHENPSLAVNCRVDVVPGTLKVDVVEITNDLFQLCVDSGFCETPDPSDVEQGGICTSGDDFEQCPVVSVPHFEALRMCEFLGRRLPTGIEHIIMRQQNAPQTAAAVEAFPIGEEGPTGDCGPKGTLKGCRRPKPINIDGDTMTGGAASDRTAEGVFDLMGNVSEWAFDLLPAERGAASALPWFCERALASVAGGDVMDVLQNGCPTGEVCIMGSYEPGLGLPFGEYPVCFANAKLVIANGEVGSVFGGNYSKSGITAPEIGTFARASVPEPDSVPGEATRGLRCVGTSGAPEALQAVVTP